MFEIHGASYFNMFVENTKHFKKLFVTQQNSFGRAKLSTVLKSEIRRIKNISNFKFYEYKYIEYYAFELYVSF